MAEYTIKRPLKRPPIHPGEVVREDVLPALGLSVSEAARRMGVSRQQLHRVLACTHPITTEMALRIGKFAGNGPGLWLRMQQAYDLWHVEQRMKDELSKIKIAARGMLEGSGILKAYLKEKRFEKQRENKKVARTK
jgi:addiction module HigA family antidote